jgi:hypothetical protein
VCRRGDAAAASTSTSRPGSNPWTTTGGGPYDAAYWSGSFMLLPDPPGALRHVATLLAPGGHMYFTQTFEHERSRAFEILKPLLRMVTSIDFGRVTYEAPFRAALIDGGAVLESLEVLDAGRKRSAILAVARPTAAGASPNRGSLVRS